MSGLSSPQLRQWIDAASRWPAVAKLFKGSTSCIGLDVGSASVKGVLLSRTDVGLKLLRFAAQSLPPSADAAARAQTIREVVRSLDERDTRVVVAVGGPGAVLRTVLLPEMSDQELKGALSFEAEKYIPFKLDETFLDSAILGKRPGGRMEVLLAAARRDLVSSHLELLSEAGVKPDILDLEALALANAWELSRPADASGVVALIHIGARGTILNFLLGTQLQFTREIPIGGESFTQAVAQGLQLDAAEAEKIKCEPGDRLSQVRLALQPQLEEWLSQCRVSFDFYENQFGQRVERLALSGGSVRLVEFKEKVREALGFPLEEWNPLSGLASDADPKQLESAAPTLGVAVGLALRGTAE